jgi:hypothetical protein
MEAMKKFCQESTRDEIKTDLEEMKATETVSN